MRIFVSIALVVAVFLGLFILAGQCSAGQWSNKLKITNDKRQVVGYIYKPCSTCRTQILDDRRRVRGYIDSRGQVVNTRRQRVIKLEDLED